MSVNLGSACLVTGDTMDCKDALKALGGVWVRPMQGWLFHESQRAQVEAALANTGAEITKGAAPEAAAAASQVKEKHVTVEPYKRAVLCKGDTKPASAHLKKLGGRWNPSLKGWILKGGVKDELVETLRGDKKLKLTVEELERTGEEPPARPAKKKKRNADEEFFSDDDSE
eukprot:TRINITY_DN4896_c0_g1_i1.p1 TRINITY_DN4896_c0_g1~~TRINITY_DN4896_c0_g1_i1.p1  ORF type:complete len:171 (-),score=47.46 TRINITY_DN4896_c0_g1_i1:365-877(-)